MIEATIEEAYAEACLALGEAMVRERLIAKALALQATGSTEAVNRT